MTSLDVKRGEILVQAYFSSPLFSLLNPPASRLHEAFFSGLSGFGITLSDLKISNGVPDLKEASVTYPLINGNASLKLFLDRIELAFLEIKNLSQEQSTAIWLKTFESLEQVVKGVTVREYMANIAFHGLLEGKTCSQYLSTFLKEPPAGLGPVSGQGVVVYYGGHGQMTASSVVMDMSGQVPDGLYFRLYMNIDGGKTSIAELPDLLDQSIKTVTNNVGLSIV